MSKVLLKGGTVLTAQGSSQADVLIEGETIQAVGAGLEAGAAQVEDVSGKLIMPGGIDPHTHFNLPMFDTVSSDDHYTGHKAAAFGGTTTVLDFVPQPPGESLMAGVQAWHQRADDLAAIDFGFHMNITECNSGVLEEIPELLNAGINTLKVFTAYNGRLRLEDGEIFQVMRVAAEHGMTTMLHAENGDVIEILVEEALAQGRTGPVWHARTRPAWGAVESVLRGIALAEQAGATLYVVHLNTAGGLDQIRFGREKGARVMTEVCPHHLFFTEEDLLRPDGAKYVCSPPVRTAADGEALWGGLADDSIQVVATDHCPFYFDGRQAMEYEGEQIKIAGKELGETDFTKIPNGVPGVGDRMPVLWSYGVGQGRITPEQFVALTSTNPAKIFGLYPTKGSIRVGSDADLVVWDPEKKLTYGVQHAQHRTDYNLYEAWELVGYPQAVYLRGELIVRNGEWFGRPGGGRFLERRAEPYWL
ncbi:MAG: dihydropyrimidinase [Anaerolineales bacterium]